MPKVVRRRLVKAACDEVGVSERKLAKKCKISQSYVAKILKEEGVEHFRRKKCPDWTPELLEKQQSCCRNLRRHFCPPSSSINIILDDESPSGTLKFLGMTDFLTREKENTSPSVKYHQKFEPKILVWLASHQ